MAQSERKRTRLWIEILKWRKLRSRKPYRKIGLFAYKNIFSAGVEAPRTFFIHWYCKEG
nr:MAG TPA: hypothetical protein [Caudoviricetes sp.]